jgi:hypothetical protein
MLMSKIEGSPIFNSGEEMQAGKAALPIADTFNKLVSGEPVESMEKMDAYLKLSVALAGILSEKKTGRPTHVQFNFEVIRPHK